MNLLVLGATGGIGREIVKQAIEGGHDVSALVRNPAALREFTGRMLIESGDLLNPGHLQHVMGGQDAVLSAFGPRQPVKKQDEDLLYRFGVALTTAMTKEVTQRIIIVSTAFLFKNAILPPAYLIGKLFYKSLVTDAARMEDTVRNSGLDWTLVRPPRLTSDPRTGNYRLDTGQLPILGLRVCRADVAEFMVKTAEDGNHVREVVGIAK